MTETIQERKTLIKTHRNDLIKIIAMVTMLIDHIGVLLFPEMRILRTIGRIAFPIFAYQIAIGYTFTSNKWNYAKRLLTFGLIAQIPYIYLNTEFEPNYFHFNVILLFLLGVGVLALYDLMIQSFKKSNPQNILMGTIYLFLMIIAIFAPEYFSIKFENFAFSYSYYGLIMILLFYVYRGRWGIIFPLYILLSFVNTYALGAEILSKYSMNWLGEQLTFWQAFGRTDIVWENITTWKDGLKTLEGYFFQTRSIMGVLVIWLLEKRPTELRLNKYVGYLFYPVHIAVLVAIRYFVGHPF